MVFTHGIYSWVDAATRESLHRFFRDGIEDKGLLYLSYNLLPGWDCLSFIRHQFAASLAESPHNLEEAARRALRRLIALRDAGALAFHHNKAAIGFLNYLVEMDNLQYTVQEFYGIDQQAFSFAEIHDSMQQCGLSYAADASLPENRIDLSIAEAGLDLLAQCPSVQELQSTKDLLQNRLFRRDIYIAGDPSKDIENPNSQALDSIRLGIYGLSPRLPRAIRSTSGKSIELNGDLVDRLESRYKMRRFNLHELLDDEEIKLEYDELVYNLLLLITEEFIGPLCADFRQVPAQAPCRIKIPRYNRVLLETPEEAHQKIFVASRVTGSGLQLSPADALLLRAFEHENPAQWLVDQAPGVTANHAGDESAIRGFFSSRAETGAQIDDFRARLEVYLSLGVVEPIVS